jgi:hypothetical protein
LSMSYKKFSQPKPKLNKLLHAEGNLNCGCWETKRKITKSKKNSNFTEAKFSDH